MALTRICLARLGFPALIAILIAAVPDSTRANLNVIVNSSAAPAGGTGNFDVVTSSTSGTFGVGGFSLELQVPLNSGITFTGVTTATTTFPYLFGTLQSPPFSFSTFPATDIVASDSDQSAPFFVNVTPISSFGVEHVTYSVAAGTVAPITVSIVGLTGQAPTSQFDDVNGTPFTFTPVNGTIVPTVPEPSALFVCGGGCVILMFRKRRRGS